MFKAWLWCQKGGKVCLRCAKEHESWQDGWVICIIGAFWLFGIRSFASLKLVACF